MPFQPVPGTASFKMIYNIHGAFVENIYYVRSATAWTVTKLQDVITIFEEWHDASQAPLQSANAVLRTIQARDESASEAPAVERGITVNGEGNNPAAAPPNNVTLAVKLTTGLSGRSARGRIYWPGMPGVFVAGNEVQLVYRDNVINAMLDLRTRLGAEGYEWVVVSRYSGVDAQHKPIKRAQGRALPVNGASGDTAIDSQRRRLNGRGI